MLLFYISRATWNPPPIIRTGDKSKVRPHEPALRHRPCLRTNALYLSRRPAVFFFILLRKEETNFSQHSRTIIAIAAARERAPEEWTRGTCRRSRNEDKTQLESLCFLRRYYARVTSSTVAITQANCFWMIVLGHSCVRIFWMKLGSIPDSMNGCIYCPIIIM